MAMLAAALAGVMLMLGAELSLNDRAIVATVDVFSPSLNCKEKLSPVRALTLLGWKVKEELFASTIVILPWLGEEIILYT